MIALDVLLVIAACVIAARLVRVQPDRSAPVLEPVRVRSRVR